MRPHEIALVVIATIAVLAAAKLAAEFLVSVVAGILLAYALQPPVARLEQAGFPRGVSATIVLLTLVGATDRNRVVAAARCSGGRCGAARGRAEVSRSGT